MKMIPSLTRPTAFFVCLSFFLSFTISRTHSAIAPHWTKINEAKGVQVFSKTIEGSPIVAFKGETVIDAPIGKILGVLLDNENRKNWVDRLKLTKVVEEISPFEHTIFQEYNVPWPLKNREFVYHGKAVRDAKTNRVLLVLNSVQSAAAPKPVGVRAELMRSAYILTPVSEQKTIVEVEIHSDPKGRVPKWIVNLIQKSWPLKTLNGIKEEVKKDYVKTIDVKLVPVSKDSL